MKRDAWRVMSAEGVGQVGRRASASFRYASLFGGYRWDRFVQWTIDINHDNPLFMVLCVWRRKMVLSGRFAAHYVAVLVACVLPDSEVGSGAGTKVRSA